MRRLSDDGLYAMKVIEGVRGSDLEMVINEASLISFLNSDELIKCIDLYAYDGNAYIMLEYME